MADLYVCVVCGETEDCACKDLDNARRNAAKAAREVNHALGWLIVRLVQRLPDLCKSCSSVSAPAARCPMCLGVDRAKKQIAEVLGT